MAALASISLSRSLSLSLSLFVFISISFFIMLHTHDVYLLSPCTPSSLLKVGFSALLLLALGAGHVALNWAAELLADRRAGRLWAGLGMAGAQAMRQRMHLNSVLYELGSRDFTAEGDPVTLRALRTHPPLSLRIKLLEALE